ncbi:uncharacterized protein LOC109594595 [Aethina tumida]|uniref:uncharacterized protein LOC109594595 n=1 Tax=Aethina tumida TaxID=116153 RepID=UPI002148B343|nr:uncharacterized protein LOC109594595 [Aethina tumida]XP_049826587.1 uncharacterized protein LOC109594595 [Aethina tumida]
MVQRLYPNLKTDEQVDDNQVLLRENAKIIRDRIINGHVEEAMEKLKLHPDVIFYDFGRNLYTTIVPLIEKHKPKISNKYTIMDQIHLIGIDECRKRKEHVYLMFFAAALCKLEVLKEAIEYLKHDSEDINTSREGNTVLTYFFKFSNLNNEKYCDTLLYLIECADVDVNKRDYSNMPPLEYLIKKLDRVDGNMKISVKKCIQLLLSTKTIDLKELTEKETLGKTLRNNGLELQSIPNIVQNRTSPFTLLSKKNLDEFLKEVQPEDKDLDDGSNTLLQLACRNDAFQAVEKLIELGANLNKTIPSNKTYPLAYAAIKKSNKVFDLILKAYELQGLKIEQNLFNYFVNFRGGQIKTKYFDLLLESKCIDVNLRYTNGNTPLHFAIFFENKTAIQNLLKQGASLLSKNKNGKAPIDYIAKEDLHTYLDSCILQDNYNRPYNGKYELRLDFSMFVGNEDNEIKTVEHICGKKNLKPLIRHPIVVSFINLKYNLISQFYLNLVKTVCLTLACLIICKISIFAFSKVESVFVLNILRYFSVIIYLLCVCDFKDSLLRNLNIALFEKSPRSFYFLMWTFLISNSSIVTPFLYGILMMPMVMIVTKRTDRSWASTCAVIFLSYGIYFLDSFNLLIYFTIFIVSLILAKVWFYHPKNNLLQSNLLEIFVKIKSLLNYVFLIISFYLAYSVIVENFVSGNPVSYESVCISIILLSLSIYLIILTNLFSALLDSCSDFTKAIKFYKYENIIKFIRFAEDYYKTSSHLKNKLTNPFLKTLLIENDIPQKSNKKRRNSKNYVNFLLNKNKFINEKLHHFKMDIRTIEELRELCERKVSNIESKVKY